MAASGKRQAIPVVSAGVAYALPDGEIVQLTPLSFGSDPSPPVVSFTLRGGRVVDAIRLDLSMQTRQAIPVVRDAAPSCYACDGAVVGVADRRRAPERAWVPGCARHSETTLIGALARAAAVVTFAALALAGCGDNLAPRPDAGELPACADVCSTDFAYCTHDGICHCDGIECRKDVAL